MRAIDTNVLVRLLARDDARQAAQADQFVAGGGWISHLVLIETTWVLSSAYDLTPARVATAVEMLLSHETLTLQDSEVVRRALELFRGKPSLGFSDCLILEVARAAGHLPLGTFDRDLARVPGAVRI